MDATTKYDIFLSFFLCSLSLRFTWYVVWRISWVHIYSVVHVQKDLFKWIMFIHCWITHSCFFLPAGKIAFEKDLHSIQMNFVTYSFRISIDSIIFPWFFFLLFLCNFSHRFFMIKFKQKLRKRKKRSTLRIICDYIFGKQLWSNPHSKWFYSCSRGKDNPLFVRV